MESNYCSHCGLKKSDWECGCTPTYPHETYMRFAEWCIYENTTGELSPHTSKSGKWRFIYSRDIYTTSELFTYWIENVDKK